MPVNSFDSYPLTWKPKKEALTPSYYRALAQDLEEKIKAGLLAPGVKLPPQREIADYLDLNYTTITRTYELCKKKGLIYGAAGKGTFVAPHSAEDVTVAGPDPAGPYIELGAVNGFSEYSEPVERATRDVVEKGYLRNLYEYSYPAGHPHQLAAAIRWMEQLGVHAEHTAIFAGAQNALAVALISLFSPGDRLAVDPYTYSNLIELSRLLHLTLVPVDGDGSGMRPEELDRLCARNHLAGVYLMPMCANPTAVTMPLTRRRELAAVIQRHGLVLLEDDISSWMFALDGAVPPSLFDLLGGRSVYICGMSKSLCPGLRIAYMAFGEEFQKAILHGLVNVNIKTSSLDAEIVSELILNGDAYKIAEHKRKLAEQSCSVFEEYFPGCQPSVTAGYFKWLPIASRRPADRLEAELLALGVRVYHSGRFAVRGERERAFLRVSLCSAGGIKKLRKGLSILEGYLRSAV